MAERHITALGEVIQFPSYERFATSGVYFLHYKGEVVYVGESSNMWSRIGQHMSEGKKIFDGVSGRPYKKRKRKERYYIALLLPKYNCCGLTKSFRNDDAARFLAMKKRSHRVMRESHPKCAAID